jgi:hypothetical protein
MMAMRALFTTILRIPQRRGRIDARRGHCRRDARPHGDGGERDGRGDERHRIERRDSVKE